MRTPIRELIRELPGHITRRSTLIVMSQGIAPIEGYWRVLIGGLQTMRTNREGGREL